MHAARRDVLLVERDGHSKEDVRVRNYLVFAETVGDVKTPGIMCYIKTASGFINTLDWEYTTQNIDLDICWFPALQSSPHTQVGPPTISDSEPLVHWLTIAVGPRWFSVSSTRVADFKRQNTRIF